MYTRSLNREFKMEISVYCTVVFALEATGHKDFGVPVMASKKAAIVHPPGIRDGTGGWARIREANARFWPRFSTAEYQRRYQAIRSAMAQRHIDCLIMFSTGYLSSANLIYVANYIDVLHGAVVFPLDGEPTESTCYHPLLLFNRDGDCLAAKLRPGNVHSAEGWEELLLPEIDRQQAQGKEVAFRGDAAFAKPELYEALEERTVKYAIRLPANDNLQRNIMELLTRPVGRPSYKPVVRYKSFLYRAASWKTVRRVVAKVEFHCGELFPRVGFIVTNLGASSRAVVCFYNKRGTAERWIKEGKQAVAMTRLSCHRFRANEVRLWLSLIAYNLGNLWRRLALPAPIGKWSLTSL